MTQPNHSKQPLVSVIVLTYKQEQTIGRTLDAILAQQLDDPFEIVIGEDCSPDGTRAICEQYVAQHPNIIRLTPAAPNKGVLGNYATAAALCQGQYIGVCAGDDWWHNPRKLQLQTAYLESHPDCVLCYTDYITYMQAQQSYVPSSAQGVPDGNLFDALIQQNFIPAVTVIYRREMLQHLDFVEYQRRGFQMEDYPMWLEMSLHGTFGHIAEATATYTRCAASLSSHNDFQATVRFERSAIYEICSFFVSNNPASRFTLQILNNRWLKHLFRLSLKYNRRQDAFEALRQQQNRRWKDWRRLMLCSNSLTFGILTRKYRKKNKVVA